MSYRYNSFTGTFDLVGQSGGPGPAADLTKTIVEVTAGESISALQLVYIDNSGLAMVATSDGSYLESRCVGMALTSIGLGNTGNIITFGEVVDPFFVFNDSDDLFLGLNGAITNIAPTTGHLTQVGSGLGLGKALINIKKTIIL